MIISGTRITGGRIADLSALYDFTTHTFTTGGTTGRNGPSLSTLQSAYSSQSWAANTSFFNMITTGYQRWTVPVTGNYTITVAGSRAGKMNSGQTYASGNGAIILGTVNLTRGHIIEIICGQYLDTAITTGGYHGLGGGGGTFVNNVTTSTLLFAAGGGGGGSYYSSGGSPTGYAGENGRTYTSGGPGAVVASGVGGAAGSGGGIYTTQTHQYKGGSGAGWTSNGKNGNNTDPSLAPGASYGGGGFGYASGFIGGTYGTSWSNPSTFASTYGGFGGAGGGNGIINGGAGGGYSGGGISGISTNAYVSQAAGGGSYIISSASSVSTSDGNYDGSATFNGSAIANLGTFNNSSGYVTITRV